MGGLSRWQTIADTLSAEIRDGVHMPGGKLPTEMALAERFAVNRHTVRRAVGWLQDQGLLRIEQGRGTFVQEDIVEYPISRRTRFTEILARQSKTPTGKLLRSLGVPADIATAQALEIAPGTPVALIETVSEVDGAPFSLVTHHFPLARFPGLLDAYDRERKITPMFRRLGVDDYTRKTTRITARLPDTHEMRHLHVARMTPVLCLEAINVDSDGAPIEYGLTRFASNRVQVVINDLPD